MKTQTNDRILVGAHNAQAGATRCILTHTVAGLIALVLILSTGIAGAAVVNWDKDAADQNWTNPDSNSFGAGTYNDGDNVFFEAGTASVAVDAGGVAPGTMEFEGTNGNYTFSGGGIAGGTSGATFLDFGKDYTATFSTGSGETYNFAGNVNVRHKGGRVIYQPTAVASHTFGSAGSVVRLGVDLANNGASNTGGQFYFSTTSGVNLTNDFLIGQYGGAISGRGFTGTFTLDGGLFLLNSTTHLDAPLVLTDSRTITVGSGGAGPYLDTTSISGAGYDLTLLATGANPDWRTTIEGAGGWNIRNFIYDTSNGRPNLIINVADPTSFFSTLGGSVIVNSGGVALDSSPSSVDVGFDLLLNYEPVGLGAGLIDTDNLNVISGGSLGGDGTIAHRNGVGGGSTFTEDVTVTVNAGGTLAPGQSIGTLTVMGDLLLDTGAILDFEFGALPTEHDAIAVIDGIGAANGDLALRGTLNLLGTPILGETYPLFTYEGSLLANDLLLGTGVPYGRLEVNDLGGTIAVTWIPEPSTIVLAGLGMVFVLQRRRR